MSNTKLSVPVTPEIGLALEVGLKDAIKTLLGKEELRDRVAPNQTLRGIKVDLTLEIDTLTFGHDTDKAPTCSIPLLATMALLVKRMGFQREAALALLTEVMTEALTMDEKAADTLMADQGVKDAEKMVKEQVISKLPRTAVSKTVKAKGATLTVTGVTQAA